MIDPYQSFTEQLAQHGLKLPESHQLNTSGKIQRFSGEGSTYKKNAWYVLFNFPLDNGEVALAGQFGCFRRGLQENVALTVPKLSAEEKQRFAKRQDEIAKAAAAEKKKKQKACVEKASKLYASLPHEGRSEYLARKKVAGYGLRFAKGAIYIPLRNISEQLVGMQYIDSTGKKVFFSGTAKDGAFHFIGPLSKDRKVVVVEGYATGASIYQAYRGQVTVVVAFDAGNLMTVVAALLKKFPGLSITVGADNDTETFKPVVNPGVHAAKAIENKHGCRYVVPVHVEDPEVKVDWNDIHVLFGLGELRKQISEQLKPATGESHAA